MQVVNKLQGTHDPNVANTLKEALEAFDNDQAGVVSVTELTHVRAFLRGPLVQVSTRY